MANNPLFSLLGGGRNGLPQNMQAILSQFQQFRNSYKGNPKQQIQQMLNSGQISQDQYNKAVQMANALQQFLK